MEQIKEKRYKEWFMRFLVWRESHISTRTFTLIMSFAVGLLTGLAAVLLKWLIHGIQHLLTSHMMNEGLNGLYFVYPIVGVFLVGLFVRYIVKDDISHGVTRILHAFSQRKSRVKTHNMYTSILASSVTIGFGGSVGAEAPIVYTGAAIGSNVGRLFRMPPNVLMLMMGCGAASAIAGIFKAPIAGILFTIEVLMVDLTATSVLPLLISSITAVTVSYLYHGTAAEFMFEQTEIFGIERIPYVILLGIFCGFVSLYFTRVMYWIEGRFSKLGTPWRKFGFGSILLGLCIFLLPPLYGEGYDSILKLLAGNTDGLMRGSFLYAWSDEMWAMLVFTALIVLTKVFATAATNGAGGVGGTFAPSLYVGCFAGFLFAYASNLFDFTPDLSNKNFALMGMAGVMSGVMHAPLMGIFLTVELTGSYALFLPLMITSTVAYATIRVFEKHSIYTMRLAKKGELLTHGKDKTVLTLLKMDSVIEKDFLVVHPEMSLGDMVKVISKSHRNIFPVTDANNRLLGMVLLDDIRNIMFRPALYDRMFVSRFMSMPPARIVLGMNMETVMKTFDDTNAWNLPVVDENGLYVGFVSKSKIFNSYRRVLVHYSQD
ncbi:MAG: chloride channel protein [Bacteroidales bacterium]|nr:chloride channel protein [Bacteroidales bacterium]MBP3670513.1 chloride channel protein [Bacteroidaceae bacterium]